MHAFSHDPSTSEFNGRSLLETAFRHKKKVLFLPTSILLLAALVILFAPRKYRSEGKLFMQVGRESISLDPTATTSDTIALQSFDRAQEIVTVVDMLQSRGISEKTVERLGADVVLAKSGPGVAQGSSLSKVVGNFVGTVVGMLRSIDPVSDQERAILRIERNLEVESENDSTLIAIRYDAKTPELAQLVAQTILDVYRQEHLRLHRTPGSKQFFEQQRDALRSQLDDSVNALRAAKNRMKIVSIESRRNTLESRLAEIELSHYRTRQQLAATEGRMKDLRKQIGATPERIVSAETTVPNTGTDILRSQLYDLQVLMLDLQSKYSEDHPAIQTTREQLKQAEAMIAKESLDRQETTNDVNPNHMSLALSLAEAESELAGFMAQRDQINRQSEAVQAELKELNDNELEIDQLTRESDLARANYFRYAENLEKARINQELDNQRISNAIEAQAATRAEKPIRPNKLLIGVLSLFLAFVSAASVVLILDRYNDRISAPEQLEQALQTPVFSVIPEERAFARVHA
ncbi:MAG: hypothetical protein MI725_02345 [Pirellulales bacterium]|nr:hypothetical protein [Pirellulales bacterium]